jgi:hypothetical protein
MVTQLDLSGLQIVLERVRETGVGPGAAMAIGSTNVRVARRGPAGLIESGGCS